jgi:hypothetical protein
MLRKYHCLIVAQSLTTGQTKRVSLSEAVVDSCLGGDLIPNVGWVIIVTWTATGARSILLGSAQQVMLEVCGLLANS